MNSSPFDILVQFRLSITGVIILFLCAVLCTRSYGLELIPSNNLAVFLPGEEPVFKLKNPSGLSSTIQVEVIDFFEQILFSEQIDLAGSDEIHIPALPNGYYMLNVRSLNADDKANYPFAIIPEPDTRFTKENNQFGAMVLPHTAYSLADKELDARFMSRIGMRWVRTHRLNWAHCQSGPDAAIDWTQSDAEVDLYSRYGLGIVATTCWPTPAWASSGADLPVQGRLKTLMAPAPEYMPLFTNFCTQLAARYKGRIDYYEVGNEVDADNFWLGSAESYQSGDSKKIMKDFCDLFLAAAAAFKQGDPDARVGPNITGRAPAGLTYKPWLQTMYSMGIGKEMYFFSTHYMGDIDGIREVMRRNGTPVDIIVTELGGHIKSEEDQETRQNYEKMIKYTYVHYGTMLNKDCKALCKFLLRDIPDLDNPPWIAGMLTKDFKIRTEYVAYATLIRMLAGAAPVKELNITDCSDAGWMQGFAFRKDNRVVNLVLLQDAATANVSIQCTGNQVTLVDVMGRESEAPVKNGQLNLSMREMYPVLIIGDVVDKPGAVKYPEPAIVRSVKVDIKNADWDKPAQHGAIPDWRILTNEQMGDGAPAGAFRAFIDDQVSCSGTQSLCLSAEKETGWYGVSYLLPADEIPVPGTGQYAEFIVEYDLKSENAKGIGSGVTLAFRKNNGARVAFICGNYKLGTFDWQKEVYTGKVDSFHPETEKITLEFYLGKSTGTVWIDNVSLTVNLWQRSGAAACITE